ncbi:hypothetical protein IU470_14540 [Nocardia abscessus]|uniref:Uncharacterized protein n=1 Tax=Nocardia abscessus TaxID=120957 RepID=A0ABS0C7G4_9NOCA|nr:hypothetical protein [Nocardia abscessus]
MAPEQSGGRIEDLLWPDPVRRQEKPTGIEYQKVLNTKRSNSTLPGKIIFTGNFSLIFCTARSARV